MLGERMNSEVVFSFSLVKWAVVAEIETEMKIEM